MSKIIVFKQDEPKLLSSLEFAYKYFMQRNYKGYCVQEVLNKVPIFTDEMIVNIVYLLKKYKKEKHPLGYVGLGSAVDAILCRVSIRKVND